MIPALLLATLAAPAADFDCHSELQRVAAEMRGQGYEAVEGPYAVSPGDLRVHGVFAEGDGHRIVEHRCARGRVVSRSWSESQAGSREEELTMDSLERIARRLYQRRGEQQ